MRGDGLFTWAAAGYRIGRADVPSSTHGRRCADLPRSASAHGLRPKTEPVPECREPDAEGAKSGRPVSRRPGPSARVPHSLLSRRIEPAPRAYAPVPRYATRVLRGHPAAAQAESGMSV